MNDTERDSKIAVMEERTETILKNQDDMKADTKEIFRILSGLPCSEQKEKIKSAHFKIGWIFSILLIILSGLIGLGFMVFK